MKKIEILNIRMIQVETIFTVAILAQAKASLVFALALILALAP